MTSHRYADLVGLALRRQPACGSTRVVAIDGPSGSGKTQLADQLVTTNRAAVLHLDDVYPGWHGLAATPPMIVRSVLEPLAVEEVGMIPRWDWSRHQAGPHMRIDPSPLLILDGVGSGAATIRPFLSLLIWVEASTEVRKRRALARDGGAYVPFWDVWGAQEAVHFHADETRRHADVILRTDG
ncbi:4-amino-4-deoxy-L-arabinose transferase [Aeromicrobium sp.]|uniref:4-amino-4-deoxy-L-arabinose transferase n=1 Tax=Aeromicrobium sp. TaxID=1871063 RepID=UPI003C491A7B